MRDHHKTVQLLIDAGADVTLKDCEGHTALDFAKGRKQDECARVIQEHAEAGGAAAHEEEVVEAIADAGSLPHALKLTLSIDLCGNAQKSSAHTLAEVRAWLESGGHADAAMDSRCSDLTLFMAAAGNGDVPLLKLLLEYNATVDLEIGGGVTAMVCAVGASPTLISLAFRCSVCAHAACTCTCTCRVHMLHAHAACTCRVHMPHAHAACTCRELACFVPAQITAKETLYSYSLEQGATCGLR